MQIKKLSEPAQVFVQGIIARQNQAVSEVLASESMSERSYISSGVKTAQSTTRYRLRNTVDYETILWLSSVHNYRLQWIFLNEGLKKNPSNQ